MTSSETIQRRWKLPAVFLSIIALFLGAGLITLRELHTLGTLTRTIYEHPLVVSNAALHAALSMTKMHRNMKDAVLATSPMEMSIAVEKVDAAEKSVLAKLDVVRDNILGDQGKDLETQTRQLFLNWKPTREEVIRLLSEGKRDDAVHITKHKGALQVEALEKEMLRLTDYARNKATYFLSTAESAEQQLEGLTLAVTIIGVLISIIIASITSTRVFKAEAVLRREKERLEEALAHIKTLQGIIPICSHCKQIRNDNGVWQRMEIYIHEHSDADFSHGICPDCMRKHYPEYTVSGTGK